MKYIYSSPDLRVKITKGFSVCKHPQLTLKLQKRSKFLFYYVWNNIKYLDIELHEYWTPFGDKSRTERPIRGSYMGGGEYEYECWYPEHFNLEKRVNEIFAYYYERNKQNIKAGLVANKQLSSL